MSAVEVDKRQSHFVAPWCAIESFDHAAVGQLGIVVDGERGVWQYADHTGAVPAAATGGPHGEEENAALGKVAHRRGGSSSCCRRRLGGGAFLLRLLRDGGL